MWALLTYAGESVHMPLQPQSWASPSLFTGLILQVAQIWDVLWALRGTFAWLFLVHFNLDFYTFLFFTLILSPLQRDSFVFVYYFGLSVVMMLFGCRTKRSRVSMTTFSSIFMRVLEPPILVWYNICSVGILCQQSSEKHEIICLH